VGNLRSDRGAMQYYNGARTHPALNKDAPVPRAVQVVGEFCRRQFLADYTINMFGSDFRRGQVHHWNLLLDLDQFAALKPAAMRSWHRCSNSCP
jgi:hypothetical protein